MSSSRAERPVRLLANCVVGLGFSYQGFQRGLELGPDLIGCDAGSADMGPAYLGSGRDPKSRLSLERDVRVMLEGARQAGAPLVIGSCGGAGGRPHVEGFRRLVEDVLHELDWRATVAMVHADQPPGALHAAIEEGRVRPIGPVPELTHEAVDASTAVVAMMGAGPLIDALDAGADVVLAGRCADPAIYACGALRLGVPAGLAWHAAKSIDKGYLATTTPREGSPVMATVHSDRFVVEPTKPGTVCTVASVAAMTMHENPDPFVVVQPSGSIVTTDARYEQLDDRRVEVTGSRFEAAIRPSVKLEGARLEYAAAKLALHSMTATLAAELGDSGVTVNTLVSGAVTTPNTLQSVSACAPRPQASLRPVPHSRSVFCRTSGRSISR